MGHRQLQVWKAPDSLRGVEGEGANGKQQRASGRREMADDMRQAHGRRRTAKDKEQRTKTANGRQQTAFRLLILCLSLSVSVGQSVRLSVCQSVFVCLCLSWCVSVRACVTLLAPFSQFPQNAAGGMDDAWMDEGRDEDNKHCEIRWSLQRL